MRSAREAGLPTYYGDILSEAADHGVEFIAYSSILAASDNDAYNTLVATDLAPELGRDAIWQLARHKEEIARHALPNQLGGQPVHGNRTLEQYLDLIAAGWVFRTTRLTEEYTLQAWREARPEVIPLVVVNRGKLQFIRDPARIEGRPDTRIVSMIPPETVEKIRQDNEASQQAREIARAEARAVRETEAEEEAAGDRGPNEVL